MAPVRTGIEYSVTFDSAFHMGTGLRRALVHRTVARDRNDLLYVPGSTIKGVLRERCEQIAAIFNLKVLEPHVAAAIAQSTAIRTIIDDAFGSRSCPGTLYFDDLALSTEHNNFFKTNVQESDGPSHLAMEQTELRTRVAMSRRTGTAKRGQLFTSENGYRGLRFSGSIAGFLREPFISTTGLPHSLVLLICGLAGLDLLGSGKSAGTGQCIVKIDTVHVNNNAISKESVLESLAELEYYDLEVEQLA